MRVSDRWMFDHSSLELMKSRSNDADATQVLSSGVRVSHPWDDPAAAGISTTHDAESRRYAAISTELQRGSDELQSADGAMNAVSTALSRAQELATQLSNDTYSASDRAGAAAEATGLLQSVIADMNTQVGGRYIFGGDKDGAPPFDAAGNYSGDTNVRQVEVAPGVWHDASVRADVAIKGVGGGVDVLSALSTLATALSTNNVANIQASVASLATAITQVAQARSQAGSDQTVLDSANTAVTAAQTDATAQLSKDVDADPFAAASQLQMAESALQASISATSQVGKISLLEKM